MRTRGLALEFGMELHADEEGMVGYFDNFHEVALRVDACDA